MSEDVELTLQAQAAIRSYIRKLAVIPGAFLVVAAFLFNYFLDQVYDSKVETAKAITSESLTKDLYKEVTKMMATLETAKRDAEVAKKSAVIAQDEAVLAKEHAEEAKKNSRTAESTSLTSQKTSIEAEKKAKEAESSADRLLVKIQSAYKISKAVESQDQIIDAITENLSEKPPQELVNSISKATNFKMSSYSSDGRRNEQTKLNLGQHKICTLTGIRTDGSNNPICVVDPEESIWFLYVRKARCNVTCFD